jgi:hypothetical protein
VAARARVALRQKIGDRRSEIGKAVALSQNYRFVNKVGMGNRRAAGVGRKGAASGAGFRGGESAEGLCAEVWAGGFCGAG